MRLVGGGKVNTLATLVVGLQAMAAAMASVDPLA